MPDRITDIHSLPVLHELGTQLDEAFAYHEDRGPCAAPGVQPRQRRRGLVLSLLGVGMAVAVAAAVILSGRTDHRASPASADAAQALQSAAQAAGRSNVAVPRDDQFFLVRTNETTSAEPASAQQNLPRVTEVVYRRKWTSISRRGRWKDTIERISFPTAADRAKWQRAGRPVMSLSPAGGRGMSWPPLGRYRFLDRTATREQLLTMPDDPKYLLSLVAPPGRRPVSQATVLERLADVLLSQPVPAHTRAGIYRAIALTRGLHYLGTTRDALGRPAAVVAADAGRERQDFLFDPQTGTPLGKRRVRLTNWVRSGRPPRENKDILQQTLLIGQRVVDNLPGT